MTEFQLSYFNFWKMMLLNCCTQYTSKFGKLSNGHKTGKGQFLFQSQRKAMPKIAQTTIQLHSFHMLTRSCSKSFKLGFNRMYPRNFRCTSWIQKRQRNQRLNCSIHQIIEKASEFQKKTSNPASLIMLKSLTVSSLSVLVAQLLSDSMKPHKLQPTRLLCPWNSPGKKTAVGSHSLLQGIFLTHGLTLCITTNYGKFLKRRAQLTTLFDF